MSRTEPQSSVHVWQVGPVVLGAVALGVCVGSPPWDLASILFALLGLGLLLTTLRLQRAYPRVTDVIYLCLVPLSTFGILASRHEEGLPSVLTSTFFLTTYIVVALVTRRDSLQASAIHVKTSEPHSESKSFELRRRLRILLLSCTAFTALSCATIIPAIAAAPDREPVRSASHFAFGITIGLALLISAARVTRKRRKVEKKTSAARLALYLSSTAMLAIALYFVRRS